MPQISEGDTVAVTGAAGFIGGWVVKGLLDRGYRVRACVRSVDDDTRVGFLKTMDAFASIISNNLNEIMKRLTSVTIVLMIPTLIASFYGMNVELPYDHHPYAFAIVFFLSILVSSAITFFFVKKKWF